MTAELTSILRPIKALVIISLLLGSGWAATSGSVDLAQLVHAIRTEMQPNHVVDFMRQVYATDRWFTYPKFQETAAFLKKTMEEIGLKNVELLGAPADGVSQSGFWTMPLAWDVRSARLEIVDPPLPIIGTSLHWQTIREFRHRLDCGVGQRLQKGARRRS